MTRRGSSGKYGIPLIFSDSAPAYRAFVSTGAHVLLLNASHDESDMYALWLEWCGYRVTIAPDLAVARRIAREETVDVLVIDACFGASYRRDEFERRWTGLTHRGELATVVLSGYGTDAPWLAPAGAHRACVLKPCPPQQLSRYIDELLPPGPAPIARDTGQPVAGCSPS